MKSFYDSDILPRPDVIEIIDLHAYEATNVANGGRLLPRRADVHTDADLARLLAANT